MSDMLTQEEISALLGGENSDDNTNSSESATSDDTDSTLNDKDIANSNQALSDVEIDVLGEIGNISMGTAATTLFTLLNNKVDITTPVVKQTTIRNLVSDYELPFVSVFVKYSLGIDGVNLLMLKEEDVKVITSLMLGGNGIDDVPEELTDIHLSAISEAMNQMIGSSSTSLSEMMGEKIDITPPTVTRVSFRDGMIDPKIVDIDGDVMCTSFRMTVGDFLDSTIMQILPLSFAKELVTKMMGTDVDSEEMEPIIESEVQPEPELQSQPQMQHQAPQKPQPHLQPKAKPQYVNHQQMQGESQMYNQPVSNPVNVQPAQFMSFDSPMIDPSQIPENIDLIKDVMLKITVELGKTVKPIDEILDFQPGSILELDKLVGESLDILANGKKIAMGEVVVIDENYGIRITDIVKSEKTRVS